MAFKDWLILGGAAILVRAAYKSDKEEQERHKTESEKATREIRKIEAEWKRLEKISKARESVICRFDEEITCDEFCQIVSAVVKKIKRIKTYEIDGTHIRCVVESQTGYTQWRFSLDFNDWGHITGQSWKYTENQESKIPEFIQSAVSCELLNLLKERHSKRFSCAELVYSNLNTKMMSSLGITCNNKNSKKSTIEQYACLMTNASMIVNEHIYVVLAVLKESGFKNVRSIPIHGVIDSNNYFGYQVVQITINGVARFNAGDRFPENAEVVICYYDPKKL